MGDPKKQRKKYSKPGHPWQRARIDEERTLMDEYGFKNKKEIWKMNSFLRDATGQAKKLVTLSGPQADKEKELLLNRLRRYGLLSTQAVLADILSISLRDVLERRFQTQVYKKGLANSVKQARQLITHEHICIGGKVVTAPGYMITLAEESQISYRTNSKFSDPEHPERVSMKKKSEVKAEAKEESKAAPKEESKDRARAPQRRFDKKDASKDRRPRKKEGPEVK